MSKPALICIDFQKGFDDPVWGDRNNAQAENKIALLLSYWREREFPVIHVKHCSLEEHSPLREGRPGSEFKIEAKPCDGEKIFVKSVNSAFIGTDLEKYLRESDIYSLLIAGLTTDHCVSTSTRMAGNLGFSVTLVSDATATFDRIGVDGTHFSAEQIHQIHLASLNGEFCTVLTCQDVLSSYEKS
jgi:nicotinamidase-related amidase